MRRKSVPGFQDEAEWHHGNTASARRQTVRWGVFSYPDKQKRKAGNDYEEKRREDEETSIEDFLHKCSKSELENIILQMLYDGPEWQYESFVRDYLEL